MVGHIFFKSVNIGMFVLIKEDLLLPLKWKIGQITEPHSGKEPEEYPGSHQCEPLLGLSKSPWSNSMCCLHSRVVCCYNVDCREYKFQFISLVLHSFLTYSSILLLWKFCYPEFDGRLCFIHLIFILI